jgi:DNA transformation protein
MPEPAGYAGHVADLLAQLGDPFTHGATIRRMFGGHGIFCDGVMFALIADDAMYMKVDDETRGAFADAGGTAFTYTKGGREIALSYFSVPDSANEDVDELRDWAHMALAAAHRAQKRKQRTGTRKQKS